MQGYARDYRAKWESFKRLIKTQDSPMLDRRGWRRWLLLPYVAFVVPIDDPAVTDQLVAWQDALRGWLLYDPQPPDRLHITLHYVGLLRQHMLPLPQTWQRTALPPMAEQVRTRLNNCKSFEVQIGPLNAFPNVLFAEVQDDHQCFQRLRAKVRRALPLRARPTMTWRYLPHVSLGYWGHQPAGPLAEALQPFRAVKPVPFQVTRVLFTIYSRDPAVPGPDVLALAQEEVLVEYQLN